LNRTLRFVTELLLQLHFSKLCNHEARQIFDEAE